MTEIVLSQLYGCNADLYFCGERKHTHKHEYGPTARTHFLISLVTEGSATFYLEDKNVTFGKNDFIIMFPDTKYYYRADEYWSLKWVGIGSADLSVFLSQFGITPQTPIIPCCDPKEAEALFDKIKFMSESPAPSQLMRMKGALCELIALIAESREQCANIPSSRAVEILKYIAANYAEELRVKQIAQKYHLDRSYLERTFRRDTGMSIREAITMFRIKKAQSLLRDTDIPVAEVAQRSGFCDRLYFSTFFRKKFGMTPTSYRKQSKEGKDRK